MYISQWHLMLDKFIPEFRSISKICDVWWHWVTFVTSPMVIQISDNHHHIYVCVLFYFVVICIWYPFNTKRQLMRFILLVITLVQGQMSFSIIILRNDPISITVVTCFQPLIHNRFNWVKKKKKTKLDPNPNSSARFCIHIHCKLKDCQLPKGMFRFITERNTQCI